MRIKFSGLIADASGKFGGSTIYDGRTGPVMRNIRRPKNPNSPAQIGVRASFRNNTTSFRSLSVVQIEAWNAAGKMFMKKNKVGNSYHSSGSALYSAVNDTAAYFGLSPVSLVPSLSEARNVGNLSNLTASVVSGIQTLTVDIPTVPTDQILMIEATPCLSGGVAFAKGKFRPIQQFPTGSAQTAYNLLPDFQDQYGNLLAGKNIQVRARIYSTTGMSPLKQYAGEPQFSRVASV